MAGKREIGIFVTHPFHVDEEAMESCLQRRTSWTRSTTRSLGMIPVLIPTRRLVKRRLANGWVPDHPG